MKWAYLAIIAIWLLLSLTLTFIAIWITHNAWLLTASGAAAVPTIILYRIAKSLFPLNDKEYEIIALKIMLQGSIEKHNKNKHLGDDLLNGQ